MDHQYFIRTDVGGSRMVRNVNPEWADVVNSVAALVRNAMNRGVRTVIEVERVEAGNRSGGTTVLRVEVSDRHESAADGA
uniref:Uncharacterized protein n=1 Tax=uncultured Armatimonadetes bacterium TaxID=157466 RepID=A0A6J4JDA8_9BACT|nr:hypothetical protein AVDCRST_MAG63-3308 [uncultured Armatimonadetes bacterium]